LIAPLRAPPDGDELLMTLRHYFESDGSLTVTASVMHIHKNTVTYRLRKVARLTGNNPSEAAGAWILQAALFVS
jgi:sugar diacid utilization regulator